MTSETTCGKIIKSLGESEGRREAACTLQIKQRDRKHEAPEKDLVVFKALKKACVTTVKYISLKLRLSFNKIDLSNSKGLFRYHFIESLILAQDERWRRA